MYPDIGQTTAQVLQKTAEDTTGTIDWSPAAVCPQPTPEALRTVIEDLETQRNDKIKS